MTNTIKSKLNWAIATIFSATILASMNSCKKEKVVPYVEKGSMFFTGKADSLQMVPLLAVGSPGTATFTARYDNDSHIFNYFLTWQNLTPGVTRADMFFSATTVANGVLARNLFTSTTTPRTAVVDSINGAITGTNELSATELADLKAGKIYFTLTTQTNLSGEIRGQIKLVQ